MTSSAPETANLHIRQCQHRDLEELERLVAQVGDRTNCEEIAKQMQQVRHWYGVLKGLSLFPNPLQHAFCTYVAEREGTLRGMIRVSPFNRTRTTWRVDQIAVLPVADGEADPLLPSDIGSQLLRYCLQYIWEARTWLTEVNINDKSQLALYRQTGFQSLAQMTYWAIAPERLQTLAEREPDLPNLLPVSNADAPLLYQLDTVSMPPLLRQIFDRHTIDFKASVLDGFVDGLQRWVNQAEVVNGYVFEPQRKAAIGYFEVKLCRDGSQSHTAKLTVHPAYTWLYPELLAQMARITRTYPLQSLCLTSADYHPEREEYLEQIGAERTEHTLLMSRSVWHKLREAKPLEGLQLTEVLQGLQPGRKAVPSRFSLLDSMHPFSRTQPPLDLGQKQSNDPKPPTEDSQH